MIGWEIMLRLICLPLDARASRIMTTLPTDCRKISYLPNHLDLPFVLLCYPMGFQYIKINLIIQKIVILSFWRHCIQLDTRVIWIIELHSAVPAWCGSTPGRRRCRGRPPSARAPRRWPRRRRSSPRRSCPRAAPRTASTARRTGRRRRSRGTGTPPARNCPSRRSAGRAEMIPQDLYSQFRVVQVLFQIKFHIQFKFICPHELYLSSIHSIT